MSLDDRTLAGPAGDADTDAAANLPPEILALTRRGFISMTTATLIGATLAACAGGGDPGGTAGPTGPGPGGTTPPPSGVTFVNNVLSVPLSGAPNLAASNGFEVFASSIGGSTPSIIIINLGGNLFKGFSSICTHQNCTVNGFTGTRMLCPCHGSEFDTSGRNVVGPAPSPLKEYATRFDVATAVVTVTKS